MDKRDLPIGFFDSGVGGISVLKDAMKLLPNETFIFYGDNGNAPYGVKTEEEIKKLALDAAGLLVSKDIKALVVACNTATSAAISIMRERFSIPIIGMEPAVKPAVIKRENGKILVMATPATLRQRKFNSLVEQLNDENIIPLPCPGLAELIENYNSDSIEIIEFLDKLLRPFNANDIETVVLGCTHYIFIRSQIQSFFGADTKIIDGNNGTIMQLIRVLRENNLLIETVVESNKSRVDYITSGNDEVLIKFRNLIDE